VTGQPHPPPVALLLVKNPYYLLTGDVEQTALGKIRCRWRDQVRKDI
jgi:hypothetical protein